MRQNSRDLYNVLHQTCADKLRTKIVSLTTYTCINEIQKYCAFLKHFLTDTNKKMIAYQTHIYVNDNTHYENPATYH